jgi:hypothetical protein
MDFFTITITLAVIVAVGSIIYFVVLERRKDEDDEVNVDAGHVGILATGMQDPMLGVAAYTAGTAAKQRRKRLTGCSCGDDCDCTSDGDEFDVPDALTLMALSNAVNSNAHDNFVVDEPLKPIESEPLWHHHSMGSEEPKPVEVETGPPARYETPSWKHEEYVAPEPVRESSWSHQDYGRSESPSVSENVSSNYSSPSTASESPSSSSSSSSDSGGCGGD